MDALCNEISSKVIITKVLTPTMVQVKKLEEKCTGCSLHWWCDTSNEEGATLDVEVENSSIYKVGESVILMENSRLMDLAIVFCLVVPLLLFVVIVVAGIVWISSVAGGILGILSLVLYFGLFYCVRKLKKFKVKFYIRKFEELK